MVFSRHHLPEIEFKILAVAVGFCSDFLSWAWKKEDRFMFRSTEELTNDLEVKIAYLVNGA